MPFCYTNAIEFERTRTGDFRFYKRNGTYDDLGYALALACFEAKQSGLEGVIIKVNNLRDDALGLYTKMYQLIHKCIK